MSEPKKKLTNRQFSETKGFQEICEKAGVEPTMRQAMKFRNGKGLAFKENSK